MAEAGGIWTAPLPRCPEHGQMSPTDDGYACRGFDGEGCGRTASLEDMEWTRAGTLAEEPEGLTILGLEVRIDPGLGRAEWRLEIE